ncbi:hypothetical protein ACJX0J_015933, partial [Zea mays]
IIIIPKKRFLSGERNSEGHICLWIGILYFSCLDILLGHSLVNFCKFIRDNFTLLLTAGWDMLCQEKISKFEHNTCHTGHHVQGYAKWRIQHFASDLNFHKTVLNITTNK